MVLGELEGVVVEIFLLTSTIKSLVMRRSLVILADSVEPVYFVMSPYDVKWLVLIQVLVVTK